MTVQNQPALGFRRFGLAFGTVSVCFDFGLTVSRLTSQGEAVDLYMEIRELLHKERIADDMMSFSTWEEDDEWRLKAETAYPMAVPHASTWSKLFAEEVTQHVTAVAPEAEVRFWWGWELSDEANS